MSLLYVYCVTEGCVIPEVEGVDGTTRFGHVEAGGIAALFSSVSTADFSQEAIDARAGDLEWLGAIGYRHQSVMTEAMKGPAIVPLRAFTLFSSEEALRSWLIEHRELLAAMLARLAGKQEWTLRLEIDPARFSESLTRRVPLLAELEEQAGAAAPGKAFLLRRKLEEEKKRAAQGAEMALLEEIDAEVRRALKCETAVRGRESRAGAFPQIDILIERDEEAELLALRDRLTTGWEASGVAFGLTGPWPPYSFTGGAS